jgi:hypothetical protein
MSMHDGLLTLLPDLLPRFPVRTARSTPRAGGARYGRRMTASEAFRGEARSELILDAPPAHVWGVLADTDAYGSWNPSLVRIEAPKGLVVGADIVVHTRPLAPLFPRTFPCRIDAADPGRELRWTGPTTFTRRALRATHGFVLQAHGDGAQTRFIHDEVFTGPVLGPRIWARLKPLVEQGHAAMNAALAARVVETAPAP